MAMKSATNTDHKMKINVIFDFDSPWLIKTIKEEEW